MYVIVLLMAFTVTVVNGDCKVDNGLISSCCCLGYNNNVFNAKRSGIYTIANFCGVIHSYVRVYCDTTSGGGGWIVTQRRCDGSVDFLSKDWVEYEDGFGSLSGEFWIGLRSLHCLTHQGTWELRIDYRLNNGTSSYLHYKQFKVGSPESQYQLTISGFNSKSLTDPFRGRPLNNMKFSTRDQDNDLSVPNRCARYLGGWWHNDCTHIRLNNEYSARGHVSIYLNREWLFLPFVEMKIRPLNCSSSN